MSTEHLRKRQLAALDPRADAGAIDRLLKRLTRS
jgi:hypothetical protein